MKILIIKLSSLGDVVFTLPFVNNLKQSGHEIHFLTTEKGVDLVDGNPSVDKVFFVPLYSWRKNKFNLKLLFKIIKIFFDLRKEHYDIAFDCQRRIKSLPFMLFCGAKRRIISSSSSEGAHWGANEIAPRGSVPHMVMWNLDYAQYLGNDIGEIKMSLPAQSVEVKEKVAGLLSNADRTKPLIVIAPATTWKAKHWDISNWQKTVKVLKNKYTLIFTGTEQDGELISKIGGDDFINLVGKTDLHDLMELYQAVDLVIAPDSGSAHLAWASGKPALIEIFCCTSANLFGCFGNDKKYFALSNTNPCRPCYKKQCPLKENQYICTKAVSADEVINTVNKIFANN